MSLSVLIVFPNYRLIFSYFVLVTIISFDLALHICIFIIYAEYFWLVVAGLKEKFYTLILICLIYFLPLKFFLVLASSLFIVL